MRSGVIRPSNDTIVIKYPKIWPLALTGGARPIMSRTGATNPSERRNHNAYMAKAKLKLFAVNIKAMVTAPKRHMMVATYDFPRSVRLVHATLTYAAIPLPMIPQVNMRPNEMMPNCFWRFQYEKKRNWFWRKTIRA